MPSRAVIMSVCLMFSQTKRWKIKELKKERNQSKWIRALLWIRVLAKLFLYLLFSFWAGVFSSIFHWNRKSQHIFHRQLLILSPSDGHLYSITFTNRRNILFIEWMVFTILLAYMAVTNWSVIRSLLANSSFNLMLQFQLFSNINILVYCNIR